MSKAGPNFPIIILARQLVLDDLASVDEEASPQFFADTPVYSFSLPDISTYPEDFKAFLYHDLVDNYTLVSLEQSGLRCTHTHTQTNLYFISAADIKPKTNTNPNSNPNPADPNPTNPEP